MSFQWPILLWGLLLVPLAAVLYLLAQKRRARYAVRFTNLDLLANLVPHFPRWRRHLPPILFLLALSLLLVGLARPQATVLVPREQANVVLVVDTSASMVAEDVEPNRLSAAREAANTFLDRLPDDLRVGLVTFSSQAQILSVPIADHEAIRDALGTLSAEGGTAMGEGLAAALEVSQWTGKDLPDEPAGSERTGPGETEVQKREVPAAIVLLSDGENTVGDVEPTEAAQRAREIGIPVFTVALGTEEGTVEAQDRYGETQTIPVPPDRGTLREIAGTTGGEFFSSEEEADLVRVYEDLGSSLGFVEEQQEVTAAFVAGALALLAAGGTLSVLWFHRLP